MNTENLIKLLGSPYTDGESSLNIDDNGICKMKVSYHSSSQGYDRARRHCCSDRSLLDRDIY